MDLGYTETFWRFLGIKETQRKDVGSTGSTELPMCHAWSEQWGYRNVTPAFIFQNRT
jgi:hypothetical protein